MRYGSGPEERDTPEAVESLCWRAVRLLAVHERSEADLRVRLLRYGTPEGVDEALDRLRSQGYVSDRRFTEAYTDRAALEEGMGARRLAFELRRHGIGGDLLTESVARAAAAEEQGAREVARRMAKRLASLAPEIRVRRLAGVLARRGFRTDVVVRVAREAAQTADREREERTDSREAAAIVEALEAEGLAADPLGEGLDDLDGDPKGV